MGNEGMQKTFQRTSTRASSTASARSTPAPSPGATSGNRRTPAPAKDLSRMTTIELFQHAQEAIRDEDAAAKYLTREGLVPAGTEPTLHLLTTGLLLLASDAPAMERAVKGLVALAYYAKEIDEQIINNKLTDRLADSVATALDSAVMEIAKGAREGLQEATKELEGKMVSLGEVCGRLEERAAAAEEHRVATGASPIAPDGGSYAGAARMGASGGRSPEQERALSKARLQQRQTLLDGVELGVDGGQRLQVKEIMAKVQLALELMEKDHALVLPGGMKPAAVDVLRNGGLVVEWPTEAMADWLRDEEHAAAFAAGLGAGVELKRRTYKVVAECVPVDCAPGEEVRLMEEANGLPQGSVVEAKWIKAEQRRRPGQEVAHVLIAFRDPQTANQAIKNRMTVGGRRVNVRRSLPEPFRCARCLRFGHQAKDCRETEGVCGTCGKRTHTTKECTVADYSRYHCVLCDRSGHATWDKDCPAYRHQVRMLMDRHPDLNCRFFPTHDPESLYLERAPRQVEDHGPSRLATQWSMDAQVEQQGGWHVAGPRPSQQRRAAARKAAREAGTSSYTQSTLTGMFAGMTGTQASGSDA